jgi:hypothetical protein
MRWLVVLTLIAFLYCRHRKRVLDLQSTLPAEKTWDGQALDTTRLTPRLRRVRRNFGTLRHTSRCPGPRAFRLAAARRSVRGMGYFRRRPLDDNDQSQSS